MIYDSPDDKKVLEVFKSAHKWYKKAFPKSKRFRIRLQVIPVEVKEKRSVGCFKEQKIPLSHHKYQEVKEKWMVVKKERNKYRDHQGMVKKINPTVTKTECKSQISMMNSFDVLEEVEETRRVMLDEVYDDCEIELVKPGITNNFVLIQNKNEMNFNECSGKTSFRSMIIISESLIVGDENLIKQAIETTEDLVLKLKETIESKDKIIEEYKNHFIKSKESQKILIDKVKSLLNRVNPGIIQFKDMQTQTEDPSERQIRQEEQVVYDEDEIYDADNAQWDYDSD